MASMQTALLQPAELPGKPAQDSSWLIKLFFWHSAGVYVEEGPDRDALTAALAKEYYVPVYLDPKVFDLHYNGFCNSVLWQLFHYVPLNMDSKLSETRTLQVGARYARDALYGALMLVML